MVESRDVGDLPAGGGVDGGAVGAEWELGGHAGMDDGAAGGGGGGATAAGELDEWAGEPGRDRDLLDRIGRGEDLVRARVVREPGEHLDRARAVGVEGQSGPADRAVPVSRGAVGVV